MAPIFSVCAWVVRILIALVLIPDNAFPIGAVVFPAPDVRVTANKVVQRPPHSVLAAKRAPINLAGYFPGRHVALGWVVMPPIAEL